MPTPSPTQTLLRWLAATRDRELSCDECLAIMAEALEAELASQPVSEALAAVREHLGTCPECREEYETLEAAVRALDAGS